MRLILLLGCFAFAVLLAFPTHTYAQWRDYNTSVGVVAGTSLGGTVKRFISEQDAVDLLVYNRWNGWVGALLYERHMNIRELRGLEWFFGGGVHYGVWKEGVGTPPWTDRSTQSYTAYGLDAIVGLDYNIPKSSFYLGVYWKPAYNLQSFTGLWEDEVAFTLRYAF